MKHLILVVVATFVSIVVSACTMTPSRAYDEWLRESHVVQQASSGGAAQSSSEELTRARAELVCRRNHPPGSPELAACIREDAHGGAHVPPPATQVAASAAQPAAHTETPRPMPYGGYGYGGMGMGYMAQPAVPALPGAVGGNVPVFVPPAWRQTIPLRVSYGIAVSVDGVFLPLRGGIPSMTRLSDGRVVPGIQLRDGNVIPGVAIAPVGLLSTEIVVPYSNRRQTFTAICVDPNGQEAGRFVREFSTSPNAASLPGLMDMDCR